MTKIDIYNKFEKQLYIDYKSEILICGLLMHEHENPIFIVLLTPGRGQSNKYLYNRRTRIKNS